MANNTDLSENKKHDKKIRQNIKTEGTNEFSFAEQVEPDLEKLESLEAELGMQEVDLDQAVIDTVAVDDTDDNQDADDGISDEADDEEIVDNRPQELTESYGTGLQGKPTDRAGKYSRRQDQHLYNESDATLTAGDIDANAEQASVVGDEAVGGTTATPDQDIVEEIAAAVGVTMDDRSFLRMNDMLEQRDDRRWELDPKSSEDYEDRYDE